MFLAFLADTLSTTSATCRLESALFAKKCEVAEVSRELPADAPAERRTREERVKEVISSDKSDTRVEISHVHVGINRTESI